jgi:hypothetical protein
MAGQGDTAPVRLIAAGAAMVAASVLADSALEHYRGSFRNPAMWLPLVASSLSIAFGGERALDAGSRRLPVVRQVSQAGAAAIGAVGLGFHAFNVDKRPGGASFENLFRAAPIGAPAALILSGALAGAADAMASGRTLGGGRAIAGLAAIGIAGTVAEATLLHFRGAFQNPAMWLPVAVPPLAAASLARDAVTGQSRSLTLGLLAATATIGVLGTGFHAYGIARRMGGWRNWRQNILAGPPLPAPPAFTGLAVAALGALLAMGARRG